MVGCILIEQGMERCAQIPGRRLLGSWLFCTIMICTVYKAKLTADLVNPPSEHVADLAELARLDYDPYYFLVSGSRKIYPLFDVRST